MKLTPSRRNILNALGEAGQPLTISQLARRVKRKDWNVANTINGLRDDAMVSRCAFPNLLSVPGYELTEKGRAALTE